MSSETIVVEQVAVTPTPNKVVMIDRSWMSEEGKKKFGSLSAGKSIQIVSSVEGEFKVYSCINAMDEVLLEVFDFAQKAKQNIVIANWHSICNTSAYAEGVRKIVADSKGFLITVGTPDPYRSAGSFTIKGEVITMLDLYGQMTDYADNMGFRTNMVCQVTDDNGSYIASFSDKVLEIYGGVFFDKKLDIFKIKAYLWYIFSACIAKKDRIIEEVRKKVIADASKGYSGFMKVCLGRQKDELNNKLTSASNEMQQHYQAINRLERTVGENATLLRSIERRITSKKEDLDPVNIEKFFTNLISSGKYTQFYFGSSSELKATTGDIFIVNANGDSYRIGKFDVYVYMDGTVKFINLEGRKERCDHPHVLEGKPCLGNIKEVVPKMIFNGDFMGVFTLLHTYLTSYNEDGPYQKLELRWGTPDKWCANCSRPAYKCSCGAHVCEHCGLNEDSCDCERCPSTGAVLVNNEPCQQCTRWTEDENGNRRCSY